MRMRTTIILALSAAFFLIASTAFAGGRGCGAHINLTEDQIAELYSTKAELVEAGASGEEIQTAMRELLSSYGFEFPEGCGATKGGSHPRCHGSESCDSSSCDHAPGECDRSCGKPDGHAGCHGSESRPASGCCSGSTDGKTAFSSVDEDNQITPEALSIGEIIPNPFNASVEIAIDGKSDNAYALDIYNVEGRLIRTLPINGNSVIWDGKDSQGKDLNSGTYFARISGTKESKKIILMK